jgi:GT2 family glycosyltransferase/SAM-dependent methyltransferase/glycosyltransferase involved in cell wall biosynthesis
MHALPDRIQTDVPQSEVLNFPADYLSDAGIFRPISTPTERHDYSDGDVVENRIAAIVDGLTDRSSLSPELLAAIMDWPSLYHLSPKRGNLLRPFTDSLRGRRVLEVGAGCGAMTRFLGETAREVVAVESSGRRAGIARARTADLLNVAVVEEDIFRFRLEAPADVVVLIGVLEYARLFYKGQGEAEAVLLAHLAAQLKPGGLLLLAIENRLGLKYFAGAPEDHVGRPFFGISDNYTQATPATFGRRELRRILDRVGFTQRDFYLPFPDYKLPSVVISPRGAASRGFDAGVLAAETVHSEPQPFPDPAFALQKAWPIVARNGLLRELANSFLIAARLPPGEGAEAPAVPAESILAWHYAMDRQPSFMKETLFLEQDSVVRVRRRPLVADTAAADGPITHANPGEDYTRGGSWWFSLIDLLGRPGWTIAQVTDWAEVWTRALLARIGGGPLDSGSRISGAHFDATPFNLILDADGTAVFFDQEWQVRADLPLGFVLARALRESVRRVTVIAPPADPTLDNVDRIVLAVMTQLGFLVTPSDLARYAELELMMQGWVGGTLLPAVGRNIGQAFAAPIAWHAPIDRAQQRAERDGLIAELQAADAVLVKITAERDALRTALDLATATQHQLADAEEVVAGHRANVLALAGTAGRLRVESLRSQRLWRETADRLDEAQAQLELQAVRIADLAGYPEMVATIHASTSWRLLTRLGALSDRHPRLIRLLRGSAKLLVWTARGTLVSRLRERRVRIAAAKVPPIARALPPPTPPAPSAKELLVSQLTESLQQFLDSGERLVLPVVIGPPRLSILIVLYNKAYFTLGCLRALALDLEAGTEIILVDNGSTDETGALLDRIDNARILRNAENFGFLRGANAAAAMARGSLLLFLNNDAFPRPGALAAARALLDAEAGAGAVVGRLIHPDRRLQEAGAIVWRDGTTEGYARGRPADTSEAMYRRSVDYGSGAFLMTRQAAFAALDGFDLRFAPAYYEDSDYCLRLREIGLATLYEPMVVVDHFEFGSQEKSGEAEALMHRNRRLFRARHGAALSQSLPPLAGNRLVARTPPTQPARRLLVLEERVPRSAFGAGFPRLLGILASMLELGWAVTLLPLDEPEIDWEDAYAELDPRVEILAGGLEALSLLRDERASFYEVIFVSRPNNMQRFRRFADSAGIDLSGTRIIYDAEAFAALREIARRCVLNEPADADEAEMLIAAEAALADGVESITAVSEAEAALFRSHTQLPAYVLSDMAHLALDAPGFAARRGFLFVGRLLETDSPNYDSLRWFVQEIWPAIRALLGEVTLTVAGALHPDASDLEAPGVILLGRVEDLVPLYAAARIFIAPTRFAAGLPHKVVEAAGAGLPTVATSLIATQMGWADRESIMSADRPEDFAGACAALHEDPVLWQSLRDNAWASLAAAHDQAGFVATLAKVLEGNQAASS